LAAESASSEEDVRTVIDLYRRPDRSFLTPSMSTVPTLDASTKIDVEPTG
jgi:hypothetical protein